LQVFSEMLYYTDHEAVIDRYVPFLRPHGIMVISLHLPTGKVSTLLIARPLVFSFSSFLVFLPSAGICFIRRRMLSTPSSPTLNDACRSTQSPWHNQFVVRK